jgi:uncharacterized protein YndB with AHSA1/START domain
MTSPNLSERQVHISRVINAPREVVYRAWTDPEMLKRWYAPHGCEFHLVRMDLRTGGEFHHCIRNPNFKDCWILGEFLEVDPPNQFSYKTTFSDEAGSRLSPVEAGREPEWPQEVTTTVSFEDLGDRTRVTIHQTVSEEFAKQTGAHPSWLQMLDRLELTLDSAESL